MYREGFGRKKFPLQVISDGLEDAEAPANGDSPSDRSKGGGKRRSKTPEAGESDTRRELKKARHIMRHLEAKMKSMEEERRKSLEEQAKLRAAAAAKGNMEVEKGEERGAAAVVGGGGGGGGRSGLEGQEKASLEKQVDKHFFCFVPTYSALPFSFTIWPELPIVRCIRTEPASTDLFWNAGIICFYGGRKLENVYSRKRRS